MKITLRPYQDSVHKDSITHLRSTTKPAFVNASVGAGKSLLIAFLANHVAGKGGKVLVMQTQGELCKQNSEAAWDIGLENSIYSASLKLKGCSSKVVFGTRGTLARGIENDGKLMSCKFDLIMIDECHQVDYNKDDSEFMKVIDYFQKRNSKLRIMGYTGSPFRGSTSIKGEFWNDQIGDISTNQLIGDGYLVPPVYGFEQEDEIIDYSDTKELTEKNLDKAVSTQHSKTQQICRRIIEKAEDREGILIFAASRKHCKEIKGYLLNEGVLDQDVFIITDSTPYKERQKALDAAKKRKTYTINVGVLTTGVNVPRWDCVIYMRPVGSLVLMIQSLGRGLRTYEGKSDCLVLDYAGCFERLGDVFDDPMLEEALTEKAKKDDDDFIICPKCDHENRPTARRCSNEVAGQRCDHFWVSVNCHKCNAENDSSALDCRICGEQIKDPNQALLNKAYSDDEFRPLLRMDVKQSKSGGILVTFDTGEEKKPFMHFNINSGVGRKMFYNNFAKKYAKGAPPALMQMMYRANAATIVKNKACFSVPKEIAWRQNDKGFFIVRPRFISGRE